MAAFGFSGGLTVIQHGWVHGRHTLAHSAARCPSITTWRVVPGLVATLVLGLLVAACSRQDPATLAVPAAEAEFAKVVAERLRQRQFAELEAELLDEFVTPSTQSDLKALADAFPEGEPLGLAAIRSQSHITGGQASYELTYEYEYPAAWVITDVLLRKSGERVFIAGLHVTTLPESAESFTRFDVSRQGVLGYVFATLAISVPLFIAVAFVICLRTPIPRRKWLWALFVLVGFSPVSLNLTSGEVGFKPFGMMLLGAAAVSMGRHSPWVLSFAAPFGAIAFLARRRTWLAQSAAPDPTASALAAPARASDEKE